MSEAATFAKRLTAKIPEITEFVTKLYQDHAAHLAGVPQEHWGEYIEAAARALFVANAQAMLGQTVTETADADPHLIAAVDRLAGMVRREVLARLAQYHHSAGAIH